MDRIEAANAINAIVGDRLQSIVDIFQESQAHIADFSAQINSMRAEVDALRKERDEAVKNAANLEELRAAAVRWRKDNYSPRLQNAIDVFLRQEVSRR